MENVISEHKKRLRRLRDVRLTEMNDIDLLDYCYNMSLGVTDTQEERRDMIKAMQDSVAFMRKREESDKARIALYKKEEPSPTLSAPRRHHIAEEAVHEVFM